MRTPDAVIPAARILLLRHGEAERQAARDDMRRLTPRGRDEARAVAGALRESGLQPTAVYASPYLRARETADIVAEVLCAGEVRLIPGITPDDVPQRALARLDALLADGALPLVVTHMPFIGGLTALLVDGSAGAGPGFVTAGGVMLAGDVFAPGLLQVVCRFQP